MKDERGTLAVLLLHGFGGEPFEMEFLADELKAKGIPVANPLLPGHGLSIEEFAKSGFEQWGAASEAAYDDLAQQYDRVFVVGLSMGGTLALRLAALKNPAGCVSLAAPMYLFRWLPLEFSDWRLPFVPLLKRIRPIWPTGKPKEESRRIAPWRGYEGVTSLEALHSLLNGMAEVKAMLSRITCPLRVAQAPGDKTVPVSNAYYIMKNVSSEDKEMTLLQIKEAVTGHHVVTTHEETKDKVAEIVTGFVK